MPLPDEVASRLRTRCSVAAPYATPNAENSRSCNRSTRLPSAPVPSPASTPPRTRLARGLDLIERVGNKLPDQTTIFIGLSLLTLLASAVAAALNTSVQHPITGDAIRVQSLASRTGLQWIFGSVVTNFTSFAPLGTVLVAMIGVGVAERVGLFAALLRALVLAVPRWAVTPTIIFAGMLSHTAADAGIVILPPLAAMLYVALGRHPLAGVAAAFAGVAGGFSANPLISALDPLLAGLTQVGARLLDKDYSVSAVCNWYFMIASTFLLTLVGWFVSVRIVEPRLGPWQPEESAIQPVPDESRSPNRVPKSEPACPHAGRSGDEQQGGPGSGKPGGPSCERPGSVERLSPRERRALLWAALACLATIAAIAPLVVPDNGVLRDADVKGVASYKPFFNSLVGLIMIVFIVPGLVYGVCTAQVRSDRDASKMMGQTMATMGHYIVVAFFAGQFVKWFEQSQLGLIIAIEGAAFLKGIHLTGIPLMIAVVACIAVFNLLIVSASAKWTIFAPVFVPMLMLLGKSPETTQALYRVGDSVTNVITPLNFYFPILLAAAHRYVPRAGMGTLIACMVPYSLAFFAIWTAALIVWVVLGWPIGPGAPLLYTTPGG